MGIYKNHDGRERGVNLKGSKLIYLLLALVVLSGLVFALPGTNVFAAGPVQRWIRPVLCRGKR